MLGGPGMTLHEQLTQEIRSGPRGPGVGAFFDLDKTLFAGFSAAAFTRDQLSNGRLSPKDLLDSARATLSFTLGANGFFLVRHGHVRGVPRHEGKRARGSRTARVRQVPCHGNLPGVASLGESPPGDGPHGRDHYVGDAVSSRTGGEGARHRPSALHAARGARWRADGRGSFVPLVTARAKRTRLEAYPPSTTSTSTRAISIPIVTKTCHCSSSWADLAPSIRLVAWRRSPKSASGPCAASRVAGRRHSGMSRERG